LLLAASLLAGPAMGQTADGPLAPPIVFQPGADRAASEPRPADQSQQGAPSSQSAALSLAVIGSTNPARGQPVDYQIIVRNTGTTSAAAVRVEEVLPAGARLVQSDPTAEVQTGRVVWALGNLDAARETRIRVKVQPADGAGFSPRPTVQFGPAPDLPARETLPPLVVAQFAPETVLRGQTVPFEIRVKNNSNAPLEHIVLRAKIPPGLQFMEGDVVEAEVGTLAAGETRTVRLNANAVQAGPAVNEVTARADGGLTATCLVTVLVQAPGLLVRLDGPREATAGGAVLLRAEVANASEQPVRGVGLLLTLPDGMGFLSASTGGTVDPANRQVISWELGTMAAGERKMVTVQTTARGTGDWTCEVKARGEEVAPTKATTTLHVDAAPSLGLEVFAQDDAIDNGKETAYEVRIANRANTPCRGLRVTAQVGDGLELVQAEGATTAVLQQRVVPFDLLAELPARTEALYRLRVRASAVGQRSIQVRVEADGLQKALERELHLRVNPPTSGGAGFVPAAPNSGAAR
jgi:uncharacterized repeat protein (TIGR01451 family)